VRETWAKQGAVAMTMTSGAFARFLVGDIAKWERIIRIAGVKADQ
jgi:hypothetical protein